MALVPLPCLDGQEMAAARRRELLLDRAEASRLGRTMLEWIDQGRYEGPDGGELEWGGAVAAAVAAKVSLPPDADLPEPPPRTFPETLVRVTNETTLGAARRLHDGGLRPLALNFANGVHPGGGFVHGARAQEETLCRSSALFATLADDPMYAAHADRPRPDSTDWCILSPRVPVVRRDDGKSLAVPWRLDVITCAAPVADRIGQPESGDLLEQRIHRVLAVARAYAWEALVLGAWGCGAFGNDPWRTARDFRAALEGPFDGAFRRVVFAVTDWSEERPTLGPFRDVFSSDARDRGADPLP